MATRAFGWVQNPGSLAKLKMVAGIFSPNSISHKQLINNKFPLLLHNKLISQNDYDLFISLLKRDNIEIPYAILKGKGTKSGSRKDALCTGIIQAVIDAQKNITLFDLNGVEVCVKKPYTDDWTAEGYLRWGISCGLIEYSGSTDACKITELGAKLACSEDNSKDEKECLSIALLSYPPVIRVLSLLKDKDNLTKFDIGSQLGFKGELGFTSVPQEVFLCDLNEAETKKDKSDVKSNLEGDSDKYARGIASWLMQMDWASTSTAEFSSVYRGKNYSGSLQTYSITRAGEKALLKAKGNSSRPRLPKIVMFEMLASNKAHGANFLRYQRACIIKSLSTTSKSLTQLVTSVKKYNLDMTAETIKDHLDGLSSIGLDILCKDNKYKLLDTVEGLNLPLATECQSDNIVSLKDKIRHNLKTLNHKYLVLVDLAYSDFKSRSKKNLDAREFEIQTADLLTKELHFTGQRLGDSNRPDIIISYDTNGTIIDNKSYKDGFSIDKTCADEMGRYINENQQRIPGIPSNEWWKSFDDKVTDFTYLFITSFLKGNFKKQLEYISTTHNDIKGAAIGVENLLYFAEYVKQGKLSYNDFYNNFKNDEMVFQNKC